MSLHGDKVATTWSIAWDVPGDIVGVGGVVVVGHLVVLVIEGGSVPVNMNMDVIVVGFSTEDTSKLKGDIGSLDKWIWSVSGLLGVEAENTSIIITLRVGN